MADFMQYQLEQNGYPRRRRQPSQPAQPGQTPVMPNGQPQPAAPTAPTAPTAPQQAAPAAPQPPPGMEGWVSYGNGGWLPPDHPEAQNIVRNQTQNQQNQAAVQQQQAQAAAPVNPQYGTQGQVNAQGVYTAGQAPTQIYNPQRVQQFQAPDLSSVQQPHMQLIQQLLSNPQTMTPQVLDQLKGREQDAAALMEEQTRGQIAAHAARRGIGTDSNYVQGQMRNLSNATSRGLLDSYRDIDINAIGQNRADMMNALNMGDQFQNSALQRAISAYSPVLAAGQEQRAENTTGLDSLMNRYQLQEGMLGNQANSLQQAIQGNRQFELGKDQIGIGQGQLALGGRELAQRGSEFDQNLGFQREQFNYQKGQNERAMQEASSARSDANSRWADQQAMAYQQQQEQEWAQLMALLMSGGY